MRKRLFMNLLIGMMCISGCVGSNMNKKQNKLMFNSNDINLSFDKDFNTYWEADDNSGSLELDLGDIKHIKSVTQIFKDEDIWYFDILGSIDNQDYFQVVDNTFGLFGRSFLDSANCYARYLKLNILKSEKHFKPTSVEFYADYEELSAGKNIALGLKGDSSSRSGGYEPARAYDGDDGNYWCASSGAYPQWISGEFTEAKYVKDIEVLLHDNGTYQFEFEIRNKNGEWVTILEQTIQSGNYFRFPINNEIDGWVFRLFFGPGWANVAEIKVNGFENLANTVSGILDLGKPSYINNIVSGGTISVSTDGENYTEVNKESTNVVARYIKGLSSSDKVYGYKIENLLNFMMNAEVTDYTNEAHHISKATMNDNNIDNNSTYYQSEATGQNVFVKFDLGRKCLIDRILLDFNESGNHKFSLYQSDDDINYKLIKEYRDVINSKYLLELDNILNTRYIKLISDLSSGESLNLKRFHIFGNGNPIREEWWQNQSGVIRFYPKEQKATLKEIYSRLDEFRYSGYRVIELHQPYEGLADIWAGLGGTNNFQVDPIIGSLDDLRTLLTGAHQKGIKVFMFGNVGYGKNTSDCFKKACRDYAMGIDSKEVDYFLFSKTCPDPSKWFWSDIANAYYYGYWGENGQIPTYNFNNKEWQDETYRYIKFWSDFGVDGIALDAPDVYYYGSANASEITFRCITKTLRSKNIFSLPEGSGNTGFISEYKYSGVQNYNMTSWGAGALSLGLIAAQTHSASQVDDYVKSVRDNAVAVGGIAIDGMNFEDNYEYASHSDRVLESALVTTTGHMAFLHIGSSSKIGQDIMKTWPSKTQEMVARSFSIQNTISALNASGERTKLATNADSKYYAFFRSDMSGNAKSIVVINYVNSDVEVSVDLANTPFNGEDLVLYDVYNDEAFEVQPQDGVIKLQMKKNSHRVLIKR